MHLLFESILPSFIDKHRLQSSVQMARAIKRLSEFCFFQVSQPSSKQPTSSHRKACTREWCELRRIAIKSRHVVPTPRRQYPTYKLPCSNCSPDISTHSRVLYLSFVQKYACDVLSRTRRMEVESGSFLSGRLTIGCDFSRCFFVAKV